MKGLTHEQAAKLKDAMREYKAQGHTNKEVAEKFGYTVTYTTSICKGICPQKPPQRDRELLRDKLLRFYEQSYSFREQDAIRVINERIPLFEYAGNYTGSDGTVDLRCKKCGSVVNRSWVTVKHRNVRCDNCYQEELQRIAEDKQREREREKDLAKRYREHLREANRKAKQLSFSVCKCCGVPFFQTDSGSKVYCSKECRKKVANAIGKDKRVKKLRGVCVDRSITLERLYEIHNGRCALCGGSCDWNDFYIKEDGSFVAKGNYPSIDHIKPISRGGLHSWNNVQLAHMMCNTMKSNKV